jgi:predicted DNA-binding transcriptional regulator AlpA
VTTTTKRPAEQVELKKAAAIKADADQKRPQPIWLRRRRPMPVLESATPSTPERLNAANQSQAPPRLLGKGEVCDIANVSFPTLWSWMRAGTFPRARIVGGKSMWLSTEVEAWLRALPVRPLKGDAEPEQAA